LKFIGSHKVTQATGATATATVMEWPAATPLKRVLGHSDKRQNVWMHVDGIIISASVAKDAKMSPTKIS